jgi:hypothetical protein
MSAKVRCRKIGGPFTEVFGGDDPTMIKKRLVEPQGRRSLASQPRNRDLRSPHHKAELYEAEGECLKMPG